MCNLIFWEAKFNKSPLFTDLFAKDETRFNLYGNIKSHTEARSILYLPISISKQLLSRGELDCLCMTTSV